MSKKRISEQAGWVDVSTLPRGEKGFPLCRRCGRETAGKRRTFCSAACVHQHKIRSSPSYARTAVEERDKGICSVCRLDTARLERIFKYLATWQRPKWKRDQDDRLRKAFFQKCEDEGAADGEAFDVRYKTFNDYWAEAHDRFNQRHSHWLVLAVATYPWAFTPAWKKKDEWRLRHLWEMDHIKPVVEGGGGCGLENLRTLCIPCHRKATAELRKRLAEAKKAK